MIEIAASLVATAALLALFIEGTGRALERRKRNRNRLANDARLIAKARNARERERDAFLMTMYQIVEAEPQMPADEVITRAMASRKRKDWTEEEFQEISDQIAKELEELGLVAEDRKRAARPPQ